MSRPGAGVSAHAHKDALLDFAYGELPADEARRVEEHVQGCPRCSDELGALRGVRVAFAQLPREEAPDAGLESLLAYANQRARQNVAGPAPRATWVRRLVLGLASAGALGLVAVVGLNMTASRDGAEVAAARERALPPAAPSADSQATREPYDDPLAAASPQAGAAPLEAREEAPSPQPVLDRAEPSGAPALAAAPAPDRAAGNYDAAQRLGSQDMLEKASRSEKRKQPNATVQRVEVDPSYRRDQGGGGGLGGLSTAGADAEAKGLNGRSPAAAQPWGTGPGQSPRPAPSKKDAAAARQQSPAQAAAERQLDDGEGDQVAPQGELAEGRSMQQAAAAAAPEPEAKPARPPPAQELAALRATARGARGEKRAEALGRLCELETALGDSAAPSTCRQVIAEFPGTDHARRAARKLAAPNDLRLHPGKD